MKFERKYWLLSCAFFALAVGSCDSNGNEESSKKSQEVGSSSKRTTEGNTESRANSTTDSELKKFLEQSEFDELLSRFSTDHETLTVNQRRQFLRRLERKVTSENFKEAWSLAKSFPADSGWVLGFRGAVLSEAAKNGAILPALDVLFEDYGPGDIRKRLIGDLFVGGGQNQDSNFLSSALEQLEFPEEILAAKKGLRAGLAFSEDIGNLGNLFQSDNEIIRGAARDAVLYFPRAVQDPNPDGYIGRLGQVLSFAEKSTEIGREEVLEHAVKNAYSPSEAFAIFDAINSYSVDSQNVKINPEWSKRLATEMIRGNPDKAIDSAKARSDGGDFLGVLVAAWIDKDVRAAFAWQDEVKSQLSNQQRNQVSKSFAEKAISEKNVETAQEWIGQIDDTDLQTNLQKLIEATRSE